MDKAEFLKTDFSYLVDKVTADERKPNPENIKAIQKFLIPAITKQIKGCFRRLGFYRILIKILRC